MGKVREIEQRRERREIQRKGEKGERYTHRGRERKERDTHTEERGGFPVLSFYHLSVYLSIIYLSVCLSSIQLPIILGLLVIIHLPTNHLFVPPITSDSLLKTSLLHQSFKKWLSPMQNYSLKMIFKCFILHV